MSQQNEEQIFYLKKSNQFNKDLIQKNKILLSERDILVIEKCFILFYFQFQINIIFCFFFKK